MDMTVMGVANKDLMKMEIHVLTLNLVLTAMILKVMIVKAMIL